jgi:hypothetical protein
MSSLITRTTFIAPTGTSPGVREEIFAIRIIMKDTLR